MSAENGGPAFPKTGWFSPDGSAAYDSADQDGMTMRDHFAGLAMQAYCAAESNNLYEKQAADAYKMADAMLIERAK